MARISHYFTLIFIVLISSFILWLPFILKIPNLFGLIISNSDMGYIYRNFDGLLYIVSAKSLYDPSIIGSLGIELPLSDKYFAAHLPLYPVFIKVFASIFGYLKSMIFVNVMFTAGLVCFFYYMLKQLKLSVNPFILSIVLLFLPRFLVVRSIGAPESLFILLILISLFFFEKKQYLWAGIAGALSVMTKTPGILLFLVYLVVFMESFIQTKKVDWKGLLSILLIPVGMLLVFLLYQIQYGDFFAYFHTGGVVPMVFPYSVFNFQAKWVTTAWLEELIFYFFMYALTAVYLWKNQHRSLLYFTIVFFIAATFVQHHDLSRYMQPLWPMALIAFDKFFTSKKFLIAFLIILPAIYLYAWDFIVFNAMPVSNWAPYL